jgi:hypothetical protein
MACGGKYRCSETVGHLMQNRVVLFTIVSPSSWTVRVQRSITVSALENAFDRALIWSRKNQRESCVRNWDLLTIEPPTVSVVQAFTVGVVRVQNKTETVGSRLDRINRSSARPSVLIVKRIGSSSQTPMKGLYGGCIIETVNLSIHALPLGSVRHLTGGYRKNDCQD